MRKIKPNPSILRKQNVTSTNEFGKDQEILTSALSEVSMALNSSLNLDKVLDRILEKLTLVVPYTTANIMLIEGNQARIVRSKGYDLLGTEEIMMSRVFDIDQISNFKKLVSAKHSILTYNARLNQDWHSLPESEWIKSHISAPILSDDTVIGFLNCDSDVEGFYNKTQLVAIQLFANHAGLAIRNARLYVASIDLSKKLRLLNDLTHQVLKVKTLNDILDLLPERLIEIFDAVSVKISRWDKETRTVSGWATSSENKRDYLASKSQPGDKTITESVLNNRRVTLIEDVSQSALLDAKFYKLYEEKTLLCLPLIAEDIDLGAVMLEFKKVDQVNEDLLSLSEYVATQISTAIAKIYALEQEKNQSSQLAHANALIETLSRVSATIKSGVDAMNVMATIGLELEQLKIHSIVALRVGTTYSLSLTYSSLKSKIITFMEKVAGIHISDIKTDISGLPLFKEIVDNQKAQFVEDPEEILKQISPPIFMPLMWKLSESLALTKNSKCILVPLVVEKNTMGVLSLWGESLQEIDIQAASIFGGQVAIAIENANLLQEVQRLAITDELTNVLNRRGFDEVANREFGASKRYSRPMSLLMLDIDNFKTINDVHGHPIGDEILREIARRCKTEIRDNDFISRYGGEEFLILLIEQKIENAKIVAERIRKCIGEKPFNTSVGKISVTVSLGITEVSPQTSSINMMIKTVDKALYQSKENGRNRVTMISEI